jgi:hypothetical protein
MSSSAWPASNRGISRTVAPVANPAFSCTVWPNEWNSGSTVRCTSCGWRPNSLFASSTLCTVLLCVSSAPLGCPVVPLVYRMTAVSVSLVAAELNVVGWPCVNSASVPVAGIGEVTVAGSGSALSKMKCSQLSVASNAARPAWPTGSSAVPSKQK